MNNNLSLRISLILAIISSFTIIILTVLMHFRYHITRTEFVNDCLQVTSDAILNFTENNIQAGMSLTEQVDLQEYIKKYKNREKIISDIHILKLSHKSLDNLFKTGTEKISSPLLERSTQKMQSAKTNTWNFSETNLSSRMNYVGITIKNTTGSAVGSILISYDSSFLENKEKNEINNLYKRCGISLFFIFILSFFIGFKTTHSLKESLQCILSALEKLKGTQFKKDFDLTEIEDSSLKRNFRFALKNMVQVQTQLKKVDELLTSAQEEKL